jgi:NitT/TauT family transport system substrate-binding protein
MIMGPSLLKDDRRAGVAFVRAYIRTLNTYFAGDYKHDPKFVAELSSLLGVPEAQLQQTPSLIWDWEIRAKTIGGIQKAFIAEGALSDSKPLPASKLVDRSLYEQAVGHSND